MSYEAPGCMRRENENSEAAREGCADTLDPGHRCIALCHTWRCPGRRRTSRSVALRPVCQSGRVLTPRN